MKKRLLQQRGVTLVELLVVMSLIAMFTALALVNLAKARGKARDVVRVEELQQVQKSLELYWLTYQRYPDGDDDGCGQWDVGNATRPLLGGMGMDVYFGNHPLPVDSFYTDDCNGFRYFKYPAGSYGCPTGRGGFYVLGVTDMESTGNPYTGSPGWECPGRNFQDEFDWVVGAFER